MTREERTKQREEFDAAQREYDLACDRYESERAKWERAWRAAGREPPPTTPPPQPEILQNPGWGDCRECFGIGLEGGGNEADLPCRACDGTGDAKKRSKSA
jgi:hypothetical protein